MEHLEQLRLDDNQLVGELPRSLRKLTKLRVLWLGGNNFSTPKSSILEGGGIVNEWRGSANGGGGGSRGLFFDDKASIDDFWAVLFDSD